LKLFADSIQRKNPKLPLTDVYRILNELIIERWLSVSFSQPEFFGILPKPLNFSDRFKYIFFNTAQKVLQHVFRMEAIERIGGFDEYFDIERINEYIRNQK
jgi:hypothetical protein